MSPRATSSAPHTSTASATAASPTEWFKALRALLRRQKDLAKQLQQLAARQASLIASRYGEALLVIVGERQQLINDLLASQSELAMFMPDMNRQLHALPDSQQAEIRAALDEIAAALDQVISGDERDQHAIHAQRSATRDEFSSLNLARTARDAYVRPAHHTNCFADQRG